jgi:hypothetical protein
MSVNPPGDQDDRAYLARLLPAPTERDLPGDRHHVLRECLMNEITPPAEPLPAPRRRTRRLVLAGAVAAVVALAVAAGPVPFGPRGGAPAWAVEVGAGDTVTVRITETRDAAGLEARLRAEGVPATVDYVPADKGCAYPGFDGLSNERYDEVFRTGRVGGEDVVFTIDRSRLRPGDTVGIVTIGSTDGSRAAGFWLNIFEQPVGHCVPNDKPFIREVRRG